MKIFGIGLARTGTLSLCHALRMLGYRAVHFPQSVQDIENHDAAVDTTVTVGYKFLDVMYPDSKFIYTTREISSWLNSCCRYWNKHHGEQREFIRKLHTSLYGRPDFNDDDFMVAYLRHDISVVNHFLGREKDILYLDICNGDGWDKLCKFLDKPVPEYPFPHEHSWQKIMQAEHDKAGA